MHSLTDRSVPVGLVLRKWTKEYGKVYGIQEGLRKTLVISDVNMIRELFMQKFEYFYGRKNTVLVGDVENDPRVHLFEAQGVRWKRLRSISSPAFSTGSLKKIRPTLEDSVFALIKLFDDKADKQAFDVLPFYKEFTMDVIYRVALGQEGPKMFTDEKMTRVDKIFQRSFRQPLFYVASAVPSLALTTRKLFLLTSKLRKSTAPAIFEQIYKTIDERIEERKTKANSNEKEKATDFIDLFLDARAEQEFDNQSEFSRTGVQIEKQLTRDEIAAQCFVFLLAGFDTTANSLAYVTHLLAKNPEIQRHLQEEIDSCCDETISYESIAKMKYLDCVMKEGLRMYPVANFTNSRRCMKSTTIGGIEIEEGTFVMADTFSLHYDPEIWGEDAEEFRPERWIDAERAVASWLAFGLGPRQCIAMRFAQMEEKLVLAHLLKRFDIIVTDRTEKELTLIGSMTTAPNYYQWQKDYWKRRGIPGPTGIIFIGNMHSLTDTSEPIAVVLKRWTKQFGDVYGIQEGIRKTLVTSDINMVRELFMKKFEYFHARKSSVLVGDVENDARVHLFESQGARWKRLRAISSPAFSSGSLKKAKDISREEESQGTTDFIDLFLDARAEHEFDNHSDFSKSGIHVKKQLTREEIAAQCFVFLLAGYDTTANSLAYVTFLLAKHPESQRRLQEEIDQYSGDETITYELLASMKYLDFVMKEALRMYPVASFANSRQCMKSTTLGDININKGTFVMIDTLTLHYDPEIWGEDANEFRPERWQELERPVASWIPFGLGPRQCIGMRLAQLEEKLVLAHILKRYDIIATEDTEKELVLLGSMTVAPKSVTVKLAARKQ
ncbi:unnamed protein product [Cylicocyclus nassatus]|uniref:Cytochrome P450 n=1 Tax=Cylicocyclus nassatus TaxID=53992 RepID=A0AA36DN92_CYLNA|nr:unnamed protein product [Cylicocyclus nassatus]